MRDLLTAAESAFLIRSRAEKTVVSNHSANSVSGRTMGISTDQLLRRPILKPLPFSS